MHFKVKNSSRSTPTSQRSYMPASSKSAKLARQLEHSNRFELNSFLGDSTGHAFGLSNGSSPLRNGRAVSDHDDEDEEIEHGMQDSYRGGYQNRYTTYGADTSGCLLDGSKSLASSVDLSRRSPTSCAEYPNGSDLGSSLLTQTSWGTKRSRGGAVLPNGIRPVGESPSVKKKDSAISTIAKSTASKAKAAPLEDPDELILGTEELIASAYGDQQGTSSRLSKVSGQLCNLWDNYRDPERHLRKRLVTGEDGKEITIEIGPDGSEPSLHKATFISTLLLQLHHPPAAKGKQSLAISTLRRSSSMKSSFAADAPLNPTAIPKVLAQWLQIHHNPWEAIFAEVYAKHPSPPAHYNFWDILLTLVLRGRVHDAVGLLEVSTFDCADTAPGDGQPNGYNEVQLKNIRRVVSQGMEVLRRCPATLDDDWHVTGNDWKLFRRLAEQSLTDLTEFAEGTDSGFGSSESSFNSQKLLTRVTSLTHTQKSRRAESRVPWSIYTGLRSLYSILMGRNAEIVALAQDWLEATVGQTIWWSGDEQKLVKVDSLTKTRRSLRLSHSGNQRLVDAEPETAYLEQIARAYERATASADDDTFQIRTDNPVELGLASIFNDDVETVIGLLRGWSLPVACAVAEVATLGGWFSSSPVTANALMDGFDENDLMVFSSYTEPGRSITRDGVLVEYANNIFDKGSLKKESTQIVREGWEISIGLLVRLGDDRMSHNELGKVLRNLPIDTTERTDMVLGVCQEYGMETSGREIAKTFAEKAAAEGNDGTALKYYARGHYQKELKEKIDSLIRICLMESAALPPSDALDPVLQSLIDSPVRSLAELAKHDAVAARMLHRSLTGYATLRRFYELREKEPSLEESKDSESQPTSSRSTAAATALLAVIHSAADNIDAGLYDEDQSAVVGVDTLLVLLGEAMAFVNKPGNPLTLDQCIFLTKVVEDLQAAPESVFEQSEELLLKTLATYRGKTSALSSQNSFKTRSSMTSADGFSIIGSSMLNSQSNASLEKADSHHNLEDVVTRVWDWRAGVASDAKGDDMIRMLRLGLARGIASHWIQDDDA